jgi:hypothetical protein
MLFQRQSLEFADVWTWYQREATKTNLNLGELKAGAAICREREECRRNFVSETSHVEWRSLVGAEYPRL